MRPIQLLPLLLVLLVVGIKNPSAVATTANCPPEIENKLTDPAAAQERKLEDPLSQDYTKPLDFELPTEQMISILCGALWDTGHLNYDKRLKAKEWLEENVLRLEPSVRSFSLKQRIDYAEGGHPLKDIVPDTPILQLVKDLLSFQRIKDNEIRYFAHGVLNKLNDSKLINAINFTMITTREYIPKEDFTTDPQEIRFQVIVEDLDGNQEIPPFQCPGENFNRPNGPESTCQFAVSKGSRVKVRVVEGQHPFVHSFDAPLTEQPGCRPSQNDVELPIAQVEECVIEFDMNYDPNSQKDHELLLVPRVQRMRAPEVEIFHGSELGVMANDLFLMGLDFLAPDPASGFYFKLCWDDSFDNEDGFEVVRVTDVIEYETIADVPADQNFWWGFMEYQSGPEDFAVRAYKRGPDGTTAYTTVPILSARVPPEDPYHDTPEPETPGLPGGPSAHPFDERQKEQLRLQMEQLKKMEDIQKAITESLFRDGILPAAPIGGSNHGIKGIELDRPMMKDLPPMPHK